MRFRNALVNSQALISPRAISLPACAMPSVVRSFEVLSYMCRLLALLVGPEDVRRLSGPGPTAGDALHEFEQSDIALVQVLDVLGRQRETAERGARAKLLERRWGAG